MKREIELQRRLRALHALLEAVGAMKSLSAHRFRETRREVEPARSYRAGVERILKWSGGVLDPGDGAAGLLVIGAELGLCGGYNARVVAVAAEARRALGDGPTSCVGQRAALLLARHEIAITERYPAPTQARGISELLLRLVEDVLGMYRRQRLRCFEIVSSPFSGIGVSEPARVQLLPIVAPPPMAASKPARYVAPQELALATVREYLYIVLYDLLLDALASEHAARLLATQSAEQWLDEHSRGLRRYLASARREASTQEMIEIAAGTRARR